MKPVNSAHPPATYGLKLMENRASVGWGNGDRLCLKSPYESRCSSPTVKEGSDSTGKTEEPSFTVGLLHRVCDVLGKAMATNGSLRACFGLTSGQLRNCKTNLCRGKNVFHRWSRWRACFQCTHKFDDLFICAVSQVFRFGFGGRSLQLQFSVLPATKRSLRSRSSQHLCTKALAK